MLGCLGKVPPDRSQGHVTDYIIQHYSTISSDKNEDKTKN
jgi:hypothetical protein